ncbi:hypothetical protein HMPREF0580_0396 [Mobiluncus mulieris ATCC 35239]|uniref:Uncharacterized protein n=1 Tax=Mobiluncus mulieris ATCC 35239 TaxID=871571 RepID=E0QND2_9ACTO|nr:hypothetical protein HMPREF0580_0396 [Mobiluncus mulieris ATCC 35239]
MSISTFYQSIGRFAGNLSVVLPGTYRLVCRAVTKYFAEIALVALPVS